MPSRTSQVTVSADGSSAPILIDHRANNFAVGIGCVLTGAIADYKVQHTFDDVMDPTVTPAWFDHPDLNSLSASADGNYAFPVRAIRLTVVDATGGGSVRMVVIQAA